MNKDYMHSRLRDFFIKNRKQEESLEDVKKMEEYLFSLENENKLEDFDINSVKENFVNVLANVDTINIMNSILKNKSFLWGIKPLSSNLEKLKNNTDMCILETGFLLSTINRHATLDQAKVEYSTPIGFILDDLTCYYDGTKASRIERVINSDLELTQEQKARSKECIEKIIKNKVTKYNHQPMVIPKIGREGVEKVLVIDQSYGDYSIIKGCANDQTFEDMLGAAIKENPEADIIIKTHPDTIGKMSIRPKCYYANIENYDNYDNVYKLTDPINPISLIESVDKVYVCTSQFGFEALMCGKEVHTFGMPFYAGWGLTVDAQKCNRRVQKRTLEELFYISYIMFSCYYNFETKKEFEIEDAIDLLIKYRDLYFKEN